MFGLGMGEIMIVLVVALLVLGPGKLPEAAKQIGKGIRELRRHTRDLQTTIESDAELGSTVRELKSVLRGDEITPPAPPPPPSIFAEKAKAGVPGALAQNAPSPPVEPAPAELAPEAPSPEKPKQDG
jgi:sec-independent protein translocase protein TatB